MSMKRSDIPTALGGTADATLAERFLEELEDGVRVLRLASPPDQARIDYVVHLAVEVREYIARK
jgi:hypothetical protein